MLVNRPAKKKKIGIDKIQLKSVLQHTPAVGDWHIAVDNAEYVDTVPDPESYASLLYISIAGLSWDKIRFTSHFFSLGSFLTVKTPFIYTELVILIDTMNLVENELFQEPPKCESNSSRIMDVDQLGLDEILALCSEYEKQVQLEKCTKPVQNRIKTNGSLPREKRLNSPSSPAVHHSFSFDTRYSSLDVNIILV